MNPRRIVFAALVLALSACEQPSAVAVDVEPAFARRGRVVASATGNAIVKLPLAPNFGHRTFTFTARQYADGSVSGQWVRNRSDPAGPSQFNGIILCMTIEGNNVWIGTLTVGGDRDGLEGGVRAVDNGEGRDFPDQMTPDYPSTDWLRSRLLRHYADNSDSL